MQWRIVLIKNLFKKILLTYTHQMKKDIRKMLTIIWNKVKSLVTRNIWYGIENIWG